MENSTIEICGICRESPDLYINLPCNHRFCYLCLKGYMLNNKINRQCPYCKRDISEDILECAKLPTDIDIEKKGVKWYFSGRNGGWWQYDTTSSLQLESMYHGEKKEFTIDLFSTKYNVDFENMTQQSEENFMLRSIKRIDHSIETLENIKGIAGLKTL